MHCRTLRRSASGYARHLLIRKSACQNWASGLAIRSSAQGTSAFIQTLTCTGGRQVSLYPLKSKPYIYSADFTFGTKGKKVSKTALRANVKSFGRTDVFSDHRNFNFDQTELSSLSTAAPSAYLQPSYNLLTEYLLISPTEAFYKCLLIMDL